MSGKNDAFFPESGAAAYKHDVKVIDYHILDTGHFALEEEGSSSTLLESVNGEAAASVQEDPLVVL